MRSFGVQVLQIASLLSRVTSRAILDNAHENCTVIAQRFGVMHFGVGSKLAVDLKSEQVDERVDGVFAFFHLSAGATVLYDAGHQVGPGRMTGGPRLTVTVELINLLLDRDENFGIHTLLLWEYAVCRSFER